MDEQATDMGMANSIVKETEGDIFGAPEHAVLMRKLLHRMSTDVGLQSDGWFWVLVWFECLSWY